MEKLESLAHEGKINEEASVKDKQSIIIHSSIDQVWAKLTAIANWGEWNSQVSKVSVGKIAENEEFTWSLNGDSMRSKISLLDKPYKFSFTAKSSLLKMVFLFKVEEVDTNETAVEMEGSMEGLKTIFTHKHRSAHKSFLKWLEDLQQK